MRRHLGQRSYTRPLMMTEYQEKFLPPRCYAAQVNGFKTKRPNQPIKAMNSSKDETGIMTNMMSNSREDTGRTLEMPSFRSFYTSHKWIQHPSQLPAVNAGCSRRCCCAQFCPMCMKAAKEDNITVYKHDYQAWKLSKRQPYRLHDSLKVGQGIGLDTDGKKRQPIENTTSYRSSYIAHPVQPRKQLDKPAFHTSHLQLGQPKCCGHCMADPCHGMVHHFKAWTLETKFPSPGKGNNYNPNRFLSTTHADFAQHKLQPRTKPTVQPRQTQERSKAPFEGTTTMRDDYRAWDLPRRQSLTRKGASDDWKKDFNRMSFSMCESDTAHCGRCHTNYKPLNNTAVCSNGTAATRKCPTENGTIGFECVTAGASGYLSSSVDKKPAQTHQMVSCVVSSRN